jgi:hypothetical protein
MFGDLKKKDKHFLSKFFLCKMEKIHHEKNSFLLTRVGFLKFRNQRTSSCRVFVFI